MLSDPQTVTINAVAQTLPKISSGGSSSVYQKDDGTVKLTVSHQGGSRSRRLVRLDHQKVASDPLMAGVNVRANFAAYLVLDVPSTGYSITEQKQIVDALTAYLTASSGAVVTKILGGEN